MHSWEVVMRVDRRSFLAGAGAALATPAAAQTVSFPTQPVRLVVAYPAGGSTDIAARLLAERLSRLWNQSVIVENRGGAAGTIGALAVATAPADGHTLLCAASPEIAIARSTRRNLAYDPVAAFAPISLMAQSPFLLLVNSASSITNLAQLVEAARRDPGALNYGSFGIGTSTHFVGELFKAEAGIDIAHVPYRGSAPMMADLLGGQLQLAFDTFPAAMPHVQGGRLRAIGAAMLRRSTLAPQVPTLDEQGLRGFTGGSWIGVLAPAATAAAVVSKIEADIRGLHASGFSNELQSRGLEPEGTTAEQFRTFIEAEVRKWGAVAQRAGIRPE
jgi:tripartite-type tricarboxylate transporter receptor subunit TctC